MDVRMDRRVRRTRTAVLAAAAEVLGEVGLGAFSLDAVAQRADVARSTVYRHWPDRERLLLDTIAEHGPVAGDGRTRAMLLTMLAEAARDPQVATLHARLTEARRDLLRRLVARAVDRGELPADVDVELLLDDLAAGVVHRTFVLGRPFDAATLAAHVDRFLTIHGASPAAVGPCGAREDGVTAT